MGGSVTKWKAFTVDTRAEWGRTTPLGTPVDPLVYMMMAGSLGFGGVPIALEPTPSWRTSLKETIFTPDLNPSRSVSASWSSMKMRTATFGVLARMFLNLGNNSWLVITISTSVWFIAWMIASSPRFV